MLSRVYVEIGNICNLSCSFCPKTSRRLQQMTENQFREVCRNLCGITENVYLHVMGEPLLHPKLAELIDIASEHSLKVHVTTNGTLLGKFGKCLIDRAGSVARVSISLHAPEGNGMENTIPEYVADAIDFAKRFSSAGGFSVFRLWNGDSDERMGKNRANAEIEDALHKAYPDEWVSRYSGFRIGERAFLEYDGTFVWPSESDAEEITRGTCHALRQQIAILVDGTVVPCCLDSEGRMPLGNVFVTPLAQILAGERAEEMRRGFESGVYTEHTCRRCTYARRFKIKESGK